MPRLTLIAAASGAAAIASSLPATEAWLTSSHFSKPPLSTIRPLTFSSIQVTAAAAVTSNDNDKQDEQTEIIDLDEVQPQAVYGVSYIGGDPCGSKYNDDPFDSRADNSKPGMPDDAKERIRLLAEKFKKKQEQEQNGE